MPPVVVVSPWNVVTYPQGGGHWWVPLQYVLGFRRLGCEVWWVEEYGKPPGDDAFDHAALSTFATVMHAFDLDRHSVVWRGEHEEILHGPVRSLDEIAERADLLVNFNYELPTRVLDRFARTALVDIDPGLFQFWASEGQVVHRPHDHYVTVGETVGTDRATFPDLGHEWIRIRPPVCLDQWPAVETVAAGAPFTTVSSWWAGEWIYAADGTLYDNNKRAAFLEYLTLPARVTQPLELALNLDRPASPDEPGGDDAERDLLTANGWRVRHTYDVAGSPTAYRDYVRSSRGEFSCVKPSCVRFQNAWISDRSICYLASGLPVVVEHTGSSEVLPDDQGLFRFRDLDEAARAFDTLRNHYDDHARAARCLAEELFDSDLVLAGLLERLLV